MIEYLCTFYNEDGNATREITVFSEDKTSARYRAMDIAIKDGFRYAKLKVLSNTYNAKHLRDFWKVRMIQQKREKIKIVRNVGLSEDDLRMFNDIQRITHVQFTRFARPIISKYISDTWHGYFNDDGTIRKTLGDTEKFVSVLGKQDGTMVRLNFQYDGLRQNDFFNVVVTDKDLDRLLELYDQKYGEEA